MTGDCIWLVLNLVDCQVIGWAGGVTDEFFWSVGNLVDCQVIGLAGGVTGAYFWSTSIGVRPAFQYRFGFHRVA